MTSRHAIPDCFRARIRGEEDRMLVGQMDLQLHDGGFLLVYAGVVDTEAGLARADEPRLDVTRDLVLCAKYHRSPVIAFVDVLVEVLNAFDRSADLDVNVA